MVSTRRTRSSPAEQGLISLEVSPTLRAQNSHQLLRMAYPILYEPLPTSLYASPSTPTKAAHPPLHKEALLLPTHSDILDMLEAAITHTLERYASLPHLMGELYTQFNECFEDCKAAQRGPVQMLATRLRVERLTIDAYNKHRLNGLEDWRNPDIDEDLESFPFRLAVVIAGFPSLTEGLLPIYQSGEHLVPIAQQQAIPVAFSKPVIAKPVKETSIKAKPVTAKRGKRDQDSYDKLHGAPPPNLDFPVGNMTLPEMAAFHPWAIKSWDMIDRFCANGGSSAVLATMINHFRAMPRGKIENNSVYRMMKGPMDKRAKQDAMFKGWSVGTHNSIEGLEIVDSTSVSIEGFRTPANGKVTTSATPIPMKDFAQGVRVFPSGYDALDFTRAVQYAVSHPNENWMYPTHYEYLVHLLGPKQVQAGHMDFSTIERYTTARAAAGIRNSYGRKRDKHGRLQKEDSVEEDIMTEHDTGSDEDSGEDIYFNSLDRRGTKRKGDLDESADDVVFDTPSRKRPAKRAKLAPKSRYSRKSAQRTPPRALGSSVADVRRSARATKVAKSYVVHPDNDDVDEDVRVPVDFSSESDDDMPSLSSDYED